MAAPQPLASSLPRPPWESDIALSVLLALLVSLAQGPSPAGEKEPGPPGRA